MDDDDRERRTDGRYQARVPDHELVTFVEAANRGFRTTREIADEFDYVQSSAYRRLRALADEGKICREQLPTDMTMWCPANGDAGDGADDGPPDESEGD